MLKEKVNLPRVAAFDLMRGYFLIAIILNHLQYWPNGLDWLTARGELFVSAAEGFFLISGIVLGIVRGRKLLSKPFKIAAGLLLKRGVQLYIAYIVLAIFFTVIGWRLFLDNPGLKLGIAPSDTPLLAVLWNTLTFQYLYGWADYLRLYCLFLFVSPVVLLLLRKNLWWVALTASIAVWLFTPVMSWPDNIYIQPLKWQLLFFGGMIIGFHWPELTAYWKRIPKLGSRLIISSLVAASLLSLGYNLFLSYGGHLGPDVYAYTAPVREYLAVSFFDKENLPLARVAMFGVWFWTAFWLFNRFEKQITRAFGWILIPFGTNSLYVYTVHAFFIFFAHLIIAPGNRDFIVNFLMAGGIIAIIWLMVRYKILFKIIPR